MAAIIYYHQLMLQGRGCESLYLLSNEFWCRPAWNQCRCDNDINLTGLFHEELHLCVNEFLGHLLGISTLPSAFFLNFNLDEFST
jgi:hypothetical protein